MLLLKNIYEIHYEDLEVGFVDGLFEIISDGLISSYKHRFGTNLFYSDITFRSSTIENLIKDKRLELDKQKKVEASLMIYDKFITQFLKRIYSQYALVALVRSGMILANKNFVWLP